MEEQKVYDKEEIYSNRVRAGKRTYFFDVKATRSNDYYLTITESKRRYKEDGFFYEKHKIFLYKEDFDKFTVALNGAVDHIKTELMPEYDFSKFDNKEEEGETSTITTAKTDETPVLENESEEDSELKWD